MRSLVSIACCIFHLGALAQAVVDSVHYLQPVEITADRIFNMTDAGMKESRVDTLVLIEKINLSLSEVLSENTPVFVKSYGRGALATASFRGTAASHTLVNWNGMPICTPMTGMVDFSLIPVYIIDEIHLHHGSASIAERGGGLGGSVNISNVPDWNTKFSFKFTQGIGSYKTFDELLQIGAGSEKVQSRTRLYHNYSANDYTFINRGIGTADPNTGQIMHPLDTNDHADYMRYGILQEVYFRPDDRNILSARWWGQQAERTIPRATSYEGPDHSNLNRQDNNDQTVIIDWKHSGERNQLSVSGGYAHKKVDYSLKNHVSGLGLIPVIYSQSTQQSILSKATYKHVFSPGISIESSLDLMLHNVVTNDTVQHTGYNKKRHELSGFLAVRKSFGDRLNLNAMFRQEMIDFKVVPLIPFLGFDLRLIKGKDLILKGNIARNYHYPSLNDLYWQPGGNPELKPEKGFTFETGIEYQLAVNRLKLKTEATAFYSDIDNWIIWIPRYQGYWVAKNISRVVAKGVELNLQIAGNAGPVGFRISGNYALTRSVNYGDPLVWGDESYGKQLVYIPVHSGNALVHLSYRGFYITYQHNSCSERHTTSSNDITRRDWLYPYFMNDLMAGKEMKFNKITVSVELKVYNLFNETYHSVLYRPMPGRNYMIVVMLKI